MKNYNFIFDKRQKILLEIANRKATNWILGLNRLPKNYKDIGFSGKIDKITPSSIQWKTGRMLKQSVKPKGGCFRKVLVPEWSGMFFTRPRFGEALVKKFYPVFLGIHFWDTLFANNFKPAWNLGFDDVLTTYSDINGDGDVYKDTYNWDDAHNADSGTLNFGDINTIIVASIRYASSLRQISRGFLPFNISAMASANSVISAQLSIYCKAKYLWEDSGNVASVGVEKSIQTNPESLAGGDYSKCIVHSPTEYASRIVYNSWSASAYNHFTLNADGRAHILANKAGWAMFSMRTSYDLDDTDPAPPSGSYRGIQINNASANTSGTTNDPYLYVVYTSFNPHLARRKLMLGLG